MSLLRTQVVSAIERADHALAETSAQQAIEAYVRSPIEACSQPDERIVACEFHPFVGAVHAAFMDHRPLILSPDMIWLLVVQGFAKHVHAHADRFRDRFVRHSDQQKIIVERHDLRRGCENRWDLVLDEFSHQIRDHIGPEWHEKLLASFTTTGPVEKVASEIVLMETLRSYFEYECRTVCGIPEVVLEGTAPDWDDVAQRAERLTEGFDLEWWTDALSPVLERIAKNAAGADDPELWRDIYKYSEGSGGPGITGWLMNFFPYSEGRAIIDKTTGKIFDTTTIESSQQWQSIADDAYGECRRYGWGHGPTINHAVYYDSILSMKLASLPGSLSRVGFNWRYFKEELTMEFLAGFIGFTQDAETLAVRPRIGWAVREVM